jgi:serine/threonine protein kinase/Tol biopolymer transport system component
MGDELIGKIVGGYEILSVIGRGGMATVYRAQQVSMNRIVALKVLPRQYINDDTYLQRFNREVKIVAQLEHRNIVPVHDYGEHDGQPYIAMRFMSGGSVDDQLNNGPLEMEAILRIVEQIAPALDYAHGKNVLHRDLKPSNILLDDDGGAYLTDFGIARILGEQGASNITTQGVVGTPAYMSPEQAQGHDLDNRSDIYSLGVALFEMATARRPFESDTPYSIAVLQVTAQPPSPRSYNPDLSLAFEQVVYKTLSKNRDLRYSSAEVLAEALKRAIDPPASIHDTQPHLRRQPQPAAPPPPVQQAIPMPVAPQPAYSTPYAAPPSQVVATPQDTSAQGWYLRRRSKARGSNLWMNAAVGMLIGCALLTVLVIVISLAIAAGQGGTQTETTATVVQEDVGPDEEGIPSPLDPTSETALRTLVPRNDELGGGAAVPDGTPTPLPVGIRPTETLNPAVNAIGGRLIFFAERDDNYELFALDLGSGEESQLTFNDKVDSYPSVSPDGRYVAFQSARDGDFEIYVLDLATQNLRQLTDNNIWDRLPSWSPDGEWIVYSSDTRNNETFDLYRMRPDGSEVQPLYSNGARNSHARWSPDGRYIVFTSGNAADDADTWDVSRLDLETQEVISLMDNRIADWSPEFSPDGLTILYITRGSGNAAIARMDIDGENKAILYDGPGYEWGASYSPDGNYITFTSNESGRDEVYIITGDGRNLEQLTFNGGQYPAWIPGN